MINESTLKDANANNCTMVDRIYTLEEAADVLKIKPRTLRQWVTDGKIKAFKMGDRGLIRIHEEDLQAFIDQARGK
jgi:excisionase family DNA binding protein